GAPDLPRQLYLDIDIYPVHRLLEVLHVLVEGRTQGGRAHAPAHQRVSTRSTREVPETLLTRYCTGKRSASSGTWVTMPTMRPRAPSSSMALATVSSVLGSSEPKPSSRKRASSRAAPLAASCEMSSPRARARAREARKVSPPERVRMGRSSLALMWSTTTKSVLLALSPSEYWPCERSASRSVAVCTRRVIASSRYQRANRLALRCRPSSPATRDVSVTSRWFFSTSARVAICRSMNS